MDDDFHLIRIENARPSLAALQVMAAHRNQLKLQLTPSPVSTSRLEHLFPIIEMSGQGHEIIKRFRSDFLLAFDAACIKECLARLKVSVRPNEVIRE